MSSRLFESLGSWKRLWGILPAFAFLVLAPAGLAAQQGAITGTVQDMQSLQPLSGAQVFMPGTDLGTLTDQQGRYRLDQVPAGQVEVRVQLIGYRPASQTVTVQAGQVASADFQMEVSAIQLDDIVTTATGEQRKRELANAVAEISGEVAEEAPITNFSDLMAGRAVGVQVLSSGGTTGGGTRVRIRGSSSVSLSNEPLIYVDGVRVDNTAEDLTVGTGGQEVSRLNDINPEDIESIEIVKGPSAATLYGTQAANGVIRITTKRGQAGRNMWHLWGEGGAVVEPNAFPTNFRAVNADGGTCPLSSVVRDLCTQSDIITLNPLEDEPHTPFKTGTRAVIGANTSGGTAEGFTYFLSGEWEQEEGVYRSNELEKVNLRGNFGFAPEDNVDINVSTGYVSSDVFFPQNDNNVLGILPQGLLGSTNDDFPWFAFGPETLQLAETNQGIERFTGSVIADWRPVDWLQLRANGGLDLVDSFDSQFWPVGGIPFGTLFVGDRDANRIQTFNWTGEFNANATYDVNESISSVTTVGFQFFKDLSKGTLANGNQLVPGSKSIATAAITEADEFTVESVTLGVFAQEQIGFNDRLFITGAVRGDDNSAFGEDFDIIIYPKVSASWVLSEEDFFPAGDAVSSLRLRAAYGQSGNQPGTTDAIRFFSGTAITNLQGEDEIGVTFRAGGLGNVDLKPERSWEVEGGFDLGLVRDRLSLELTYYHKETNDALIFRNVAPSLGVGGAGEVAPALGSGGRWENIGSTRNSGFEGALSALVLDMEEVSLDLTLSGSLNDNELLELGEGVEPIPLGFNQRHVEGHPLGAYWGFPFEFSDANGDGLIGLDEVTVGDTLVFIDDAIPTREASLRGTLGLFDFVRVSTLFDYRGGHSQDNNTENFRCLLGNAQSRHDPATPLEEQARCIANAFFGAESGYVEDAAFLKWRELSLTLFAPESFTGGLGLDRLSLTFSGRNLATWTDYSGIDPELNQFGQNNFSTADFLTQPPVRYWTARLNVNF